MHDSRMRTDDEADETPVVISYSGGASSQWLIEAMIRGLLPRPKHIAVSFADTIEEHVWTYEAAASVEERCKSEGIEFIRCSKFESLGEHLIAINRDGKTRADHPPFWIAKDGGGVGRAEHRCTREFKIAPMRRAVSQWLKRSGLPKRVIKWIGFGADEVGRAIKSNSKRDVQWESLEFPAIRLGVPRGRQRIDLERWTGKPAPRFSMCTICPYKSPDRWRQTPDAQLHRVYEIDEAIRDMHRVGLTEGDAYLTDRLIPIERLIKKGDPQPMLPGFDSHCDGGYCFL